MVWLLLATGCGEFGLDPVDPGAEPVRVLFEDRFVQSPEPAIDLLFVVDDTASMAQEQAALGAAASALVTSLEDAGLAWQAGVVSTERAGPESGWLQGDPFVLTPGIPDVEARFAEAFAVGTAGAGPEAGLAAALLVLESAGEGGPNAGFRRPQAALHVVFVSDDDDASDAWLGADPVAVFLEAMGVQERDGLTARASAVIGLPPSGCTTPDGTARPGPRYHEVATRTGGTVASICAADFSPLLAALADVAPSYPVRFALSDTPAEGTVRVDVDGERIPDGWALDLSGGAAIVFEEPPAAGAEIVVTYTVEVTA